MYGVLWQILVNGAVAGSLYGLIALGFGLTFRVCRFFNLAHGAVYTLGAYSVYTLARSYGWPPALAIPTAIILSAFVGCAIDVFIYRFLRNRNATSLMMLVASLGIYIAIQNSISLLFGDAPLRLRTGEIVEGLNILFGARATSVQLTTVIACLLLTSALWMWLRHTVLGRMMRAVAIDSELSTIVGIKRERIFVVTIAVASILAACVGILAGFDTDLVPSMGFSALLMGSAAMLLGGVGNVWGSYLGGLAIGAVQHFSALLLATQWQDTSIFVVMVLCLLVRPRGFLALQNYKTRV